MRKENSKSLNLSVTTKCQVCKRLRPKTQTAMYNTDAIDERLRVPSI
jgi:hypothetical protein